jgi:hypothetical protein
MMMLLFFFVVTIVSAQLSFPPPTLVHHFPFDNAQVRDIVGSASGSLMGAGASFVTGSDCKFGDCVQTSAPYDLVALNAIADFPTGT